MTNRWAVDEFGQIDGVLSFSNNGEKMIKQSLRSASLIMFLLLIVNFAQAVDFGLDSATITNLYWSKKVGERIIKVHKIINNKQNYIYDDAVVEETIDGVNCLRITSVDTFNAWFTSLWIAQDTSGNVYALKLYDTENSAPIIFGKSSPMLLFPNVIQVGSVIKGSETVVEVGVSVGQLSSGFGPYTDCIKTVEGDGDFVYYAPNVGDVKKESVANERTWELKEVINTKNKVVVIPL